MKRDILELLNAARTGKRPVALVTRFDDGAQALVTETDTHGDLDLDDLALAEIRADFASERAKIHDTPTDGEMFVQIFAPPPRLLLVGAVHIAQALVPMAALAGYAITLCDPRRAFAADARFPGVTLLGDWPDEALELLAPDVRTAIVTLTHDPKLDDPALETALQSPAFYIGALGSKKTHQARLDRLRARGYAAAELARIRGPVGLDIGAVTPAEIAVSILAEMTRVRRHGS